MNATEKKKLVHAAIEALAADSSGTHGKRGARTVAESLNVLGAALGPADVPKLLELSLLEILECIDVKMLLTLAGDE